jgi:fluoride ion exporter CrcB/FEX
VVEIVVTLIVGYGGGGGAFLRRWVEEVVGCQRVLNAQG